MYSLKIHSVFHTTWKTVLHFQHDPLWYSGNWKLCRHRKGYAKKSKNKTVQSLKKYPIKSHLKCFSWRLPWPGWLRISHKCQVRFFTRFDLIFKLTAPSNKGWLATDHLFTIFRLITLKLHPKYVKCWFHV